MMDGWVLAAILAGFGGLGLGLGLVLGAFVAKMLRMYMKNEGLGEERKADEPGK